MKVIPMLWFAFWSWHFFSSQLLEAARSLQKLFAGFFAQRQREFNINKSTTKMSEKEPAAKSWEKEAKEVGLQELTPEQAAIGALILPEFGMIEDPLLKVRCTQPSHPT